MAAEFRHQLARQDERVLCDFRVVEVPIDGLASQPIVPVVDGFSCHSCRFLTVSRSVEQKHIGKVLSKRDKEDKCIFARVRQQSWYGPKRERYWVVDESEDCISSNRTKKRATRDATRRGKTDGYKEPGEQDKVAEAIQCWQAKGTERSLTLQCKAAGV